MKKAISLFLTFLIIVLAFPRFTASAYYKSGTVGNIEYTINGGHLIISGSGGMGYTARWPWGREITELTILDGVTSITRTAFSECQNLSYVELPDSLKIIENNAFYGCENLGFIDIPSNVSKIGNSAFADCTNLTRIVLPRDLTELGAGMLDGCISLERIEVDDGNKKFCSIDGVLFSADKTTLIKYPMGRYDEYYSIPSGVKTISESAFGGASYLEDIDIPSSVTKIGKNAFVGTRFFDLFTSYQNGVFTVGHCALTAEGDFGSIFTDGYSVIADGAFEYCSGLTGMHIKSEITRIGKDTFKNCENLTRLALPTSVKTIEENAFSGCDALKDVYFSGTPTEAQKIKIASGNGALTMAKWHYNRCGYREDHYWLFYSRVEPTCAKNGKLTEQCMFCDKLRSESIEKTSHSWKLNMVKKASCKSAGLKQKTCEVCNKTESQVVAPLGHKFDKTTLDGQVSCKDASDVKCRRCSFIAAGSEALISHKYKLWKEIKEPTCTQEGKEERVCGDCNKKQTRTISPLGHLFSEDAVKKEATLYSEGLVDGKCKRCKQAVKEKLPCTYYNKKLGIKIEAAEGVFKKGTEISVIKVDDGSPLIPKMEGLPERFAAYSITAKNGSKTVKPNGKFDVIITIPKDFSEDVELYSLGLSDADEVKHSLSADKKTIKAEVSSFGNYAVCDFSGGIVVSGEKKVDGDIGLKNALDFDIDVGPILRFSLLVLVSFVLAAVIVVSGMLIIKKIRKKKT